MRPCFDGKALAPKVIAILHERARQKRLIVDKNKRLLHIVAVDALYALALDGHEMLNGNRLILQVWEKITRKASFLAIPNQANNDGGLERIEKGCFFKATRRLEPKRKRRRKTRDTGPIE
jgi:hypothetical protein